MEEPNYYQLLSISSDANANEIVKAFHGICEKFCVFPYATDDEISKINPELLPYKKAYTVLSNSEKRERYDQELKYLAEQHNRLNDHNYQKTISDTTDLKNIIPFAFGLNSMKENSFIEVKANINEYLFSRGKECLNNGEYHEAINIFRKLINIKNEARYHSYLALALTKKGWNAYAQEEFKLALEIDPLDEIALENYEHPESHDKAKTTSKLDSREIESDIPKTTFFDKLKKILNTKII